MLHDSFAFSKSSSTISISSASSIRTLSGLIIAHLPYPYVGSTYTSAFSPFFIDRIAVSSASSKSPSMSRILRCSNDSYTNVSLDDGRSRIARHSADTIASAPSFGRSHPSPSTSTFLVTIPSLLISSIFNHPTSLIAYTASLISAFTRPGHAHRGATVSTITRAPFFISFTTASSSSFPATTGSFARMLNVSTVGGTIATLRSVPVYTPTSIVTSDILPGLSQPSPSSSTVLIAHPSPSTSRWHTHPTSSISN
mmetsp:Transcript_11721/g.25325  ORF Transcript_11721/g.25325 Transcript_11721/m.25325 type:complete len:254 (+) Transcript_11721:322-1083(+)